jgi:hypothetical protein
MRTPEDALTTVPIDDYRLTELVRGCLAHPCCARLLHWLYAHPTTVMTETDIEALLRMTAADTRSAIERLSARGFLRHVSAGGLTFYGLTEDAQIHALLGRFEGWCDAQHDRLAAWHGLVR